MSDMPKDYFDIVIVDAPPGAGKNAPGRMQSIYEAGRRVTREGWIYVHDMKRPVEKAVTAMLLVKELGFKKTRVTENLAAFRRP
jgi:Mrp family chromosome partitioning ATPase